MGRAGFPAGPATHCLTLRVPFWKNDAACYVGSPCILTYVDLVWNQPLEVSVIFILQRKPGVSLYHLLA